MASYKQIVPHVFKWEGGLVYFPTEGQWTNKGVQFSTFKALAPTLLGLANPTLDDLKTMTNEQAEKFIKYYWDKATYNNSIGNQDSANLMFQALWGSGATGIKQMQKAVGASPDGVVGPQTVGLVNTTPKASEKLYLALNNYYKYLAKVNPEKYQRFLNGWLQRLGELSPQVKGGIVGLAILSLALIIFLNK